MKYNPHDDEEPLPIDDRPFAPNYNRGKKGTRLESAQRWDGVFSTMGGLMVAPILLMGFSLMESARECLPDLIYKYGTCGFGWVNWLMVLSFPIYFSIMLYAQYKVHKVGFSCPGAPVSNM